jgi:ABC-2 type transport system permease protein
LRVANIYRLGVKELRSLTRDPVMLVLIAYVFSLGVYVAATVIPDTLHNAPIAVVDEDASPLSRRIVDAFYPPLFQRPAILPIDQENRGLDKGNYTFILDIPPNYQSDLLKGKSPAAQLNVDANQIVQAFTGSGYIEEMVTQEVSTFLRNDEPMPPAPIAIDMRASFNPTLTQAWFGALMEIINNVTMVAMILTGAALIREREHGTIEHLLAMPVSPMEIMIAKIWSMGAVVLCACAFSLVFVVQLVLRVPIAGSIPLFLCGAALNIFATTSLGIFLGTVARSMQQFGIIVILVLVPLEILSGGMTPQDSMPAIVQDLMIVAPTTHFVNFAQGILYRGAGIDIVWPEFLYLLAIGALFFSASAWYFRKAMMKMG